MGMLDGTVWDEAQVDAMEYARFGGMSHPEVTDEQLDQASQWHLMAYYVTDYFDVHYRTRRDLPGAQRFASRLALFMPLETPGSPAGTPPPANPAERGLADLWRRIAPAMPRELRVRLRRNMSEYCDRYPQELWNAVHSRVPDLGEYSAQRVGTFGFKWTEDLLRHWVGPDLPPEDIFDTWQLREVSDIFAEAVAFQCDTLVYAGEAHTIAAFNNGVTVVQRFLGPDGHSDPQRAGELLNNLATARLRRFESLASREIPAMLEHHNVNAPQRQALTTLLRWMRYIIGAAHEWLRRRQLEGTGLRLPTQPRKAPTTLPTGPTGIGTSSLRGHLI
ncbi:hypothetical protein ACIQ6Y_37150 [Streptomyces sp. NPDC096205]|uniref:terpene synthase family protein n=1 Tax=Streptomyces sp. NPDC096205 TaxID=3366081 RepID=UPI003814000A